MSLHFAWQILRLYLIPVSYSCIDLVQVSPYFVFEEPWRSQLDVWAKNSNPTWVCLKIGSLKPLLWFKDSIEALGRPHVQVMDFRSATIDIDTGWRRKITRRTTGARGCEFLQVLNNLIYVEPFSLSISVYLGLYQSIST